MQIALNSGNAGKAAPAPVAGSFSLKARAEGLMVPANPLTIRAIPACKDVQALANYQYVYVMKDLSKTYPGGRQVLKNIWLSFLPGAKIGVLGVNGSGKSTLMKIMAGLDRDYNGEAWAAEGVRVGYLSQEPQLDPTLDVVGNVMLGVKATKDLLV